MNDFRSKRDVCARCTVLVDILETLLNLQVVRFMCPMPCARYNMIYDGLTEFSTFGYITYRMLTWRRIFNAIVAALNDPLDQPRRPLAVTMLKKIGQQLRDAELFSVRTGISQDEKVAALRDFVLLHHEEVKPVVTLHIAVWEPASYERLFGQELAALLTNLHHARGQQQDPHQWELIPLDEQQQDIQEGQHVQNENRVDPLQPEAVPDGMGRIQHLQQGAFNRGSEQALQQRLLAAIDRGEDGQDILRQLYDLGEARRAAQNEAAVEDQFSVSYNGVATFNGSQESTGPQGGRDLFGTPMQMNRVPQIITPATQQGSFAGGIAPPFMAGKYRSPMKNTHLWYMALHSIYFIHATSFVTISYL